MYPATVQYRTVDAIEDCLSKPRCLCGHVPAIAESFTMLSLTNFSKCIIDNGLHGLHREFVNKKTCLLRMS